MATVNDLEDKVIPSLSGNFGAVAPQGLDYNLDKGTKGSPLTPPHLADAFASANGKAKRKLGNLTHYHLVSELHP